MPFPAWPWEGMCVLLYPLEAVYGQHGQTYPKVRENGDEGRSAGVVGVPPGHEAGEGCCSGLSLQAQGSPEGHHSEPRAGLGPGYLGHDFSRFPLHESILARVDPAFAVVTGNAT